MKLLAALALVCAALVVATAALPFNAANSDEITSLPGLSDAIDFRQYAGYLTVNEATQRKLFYWHVEYEGETNDDTPLILWLNGGPGCSSVSGFFTENGPFLVSSDRKTLSLNPERWNQLGNVFWIEAPAGVGFSNSASKADYNTNDAKTAADNYRAIQEFLAKYPQYRSSKLYITGESYAGHYVPTLVKHITEKNIEGKEAHINIAGLAIGNPLIDEKLDFNSPMPYFYGHALISKEDFDAAEKLCGGDFTSDAPGCQKACNKAMGGVGNIDNYDLYEDVCLENELLGISNSSFSREHTQMSTLMSFHPTFGEQPITPPCVDNYVNDYLNTVEVQQAIHADPTHWSQCTNKINYDFSHESMLPLLEYFMHNTTLDVLTYSGDLDGVLPFLGTMSWIRELSCEVVEPWRKWLGSDGQVAGYVTAYSNRFTFATFKGAGHMVPEFRPKHALDGMTRWMSGKKM